jgi:cysteine sulfinate desulfinase/cysteine desulfurase-like protein
METPPAVYLDYNATTPLDSSVIKVIEESSRLFWANPSSNYESGRKAKNVVETARGLIGQMIGAHFPDREITFTSGGTEVH